MPRSYSIGEFADELGVHVQTVKRWCRNDDLDYTRTPGGERRIPHRELRRLAGDTRPTDRVALYARVSSHGQKDNGDLDRQLDRLTDYAHDHGWSVENTYTDVGSGLNEDRRGLDSLLDDVQEADYGRIRVITHTADEPLTKACARIPAEFGYYEIKSRYYNPPQTAKTEFPTVDRLTWNDP
jgi:putative resolvase